MVSLLSENHIKAPVSPRMPPCRLFDLNSNYSYTSQAGAVGIERRCSLYNFSLVLVTKPHFLESLVNAV